MKYVTNPERALDYKLCVTVSEAACNPYTSADMVTVSAEVRGVMSRFAAHGEAEIRELLTVLETACVEIRMMLDGKP